MIKIINKIKEILNGYKQVQLLAHEKYTLLDQVAEANKRIKALENEKTPAETQKLIDYYDNKHKHKDLVWAGLTIQTKKLKTLKPSILLSDFIHVTESMRRWIRELHGMHFKQERTPENMSKYSWEVYKKFLLFKEYIYDKELYDEEDYWQPNFTQYYVKKSGNFYGDCENHANFCLGLILAAGIPRGLARVTCGTTNSGQGHASLTVWDWRTQKFEQWETTTTVQKIEGPGGEVKYIWPDPVKETDPIYIKDVWFSYDNEMSWTNLEKTKYDELKVEVKA